MNPGTDIRELTLEELAVCAQECELAQDKDRYFTELVSRLDGRLRSYLLRRLGSHSQDVHDIDDIIQETFLRAYRHIDRYQREWRVSTWIFTIATRLAANQQRNRRSRGRAGESIAREPGLAAGGYRDDPPPHALVEARREGEHLWKTAKATLNDAQYQVLWLHYARDMSIKEIARATGRTAIHVKVMLYRCRRKLADEVRS